MRTQDEIAARIKERMAGDLLGFEWQEYLIYLDFEHAREFLKPDALAEEWNADVFQSLDDCELKTKLLDYIPFAWEKANGHRGISASRSLAHFVAWFWLLGEEEMAEAMDGHYDFYGRDKLVQVTEWAGLNLADFDDGVRKNEE